MKEYKIEIKGKYKGYDYLILGLVMGHRCGYVRIPAGHRLYGLSYSEQIPVKFKELKGEKIGKRGIVPIFCAGNLKPDDNVSMDLLFDVHGGITFSGKDVAGKKGWWIGFDCAHSGDARDVGLMDERHKKINEEIHLDFPGDIVRTTEYVEKNCKNLIEQIIRWFN